MESLANNVPNDMSSYINIAIICLVLGLHPFLVQHLYTSATQAWETISTDRPTEFKIKPV